MPAPLLVFFESKRFCSQRHLRSASTEDVCGDFAAFRYFQRACGGLGQKDGGPACLFWWGDPGIDLAYGARSSKAREKTLSQAATGKRTRDCKSGDQADDQSATKGERVMGCKAR